MRKIEKEMLAAIVAKKNYSNDNTQVRVEGNAVKVYLHDNLIARISENDLWLSDGGWQSKTTKSRLNCLLTHYELPNIYQKDYQWYIWEEEEWTGSKTFQLQPINELNESQPKEFDAVLGGQNLQPSPYDLVFSRKVQH